MFSDGVLVVWLCESFGLCAARFAMASSVACHDGMTFSRRAARIGAEARMVGGV